MSTGKFNWKSIFIQDTEETSHKSEANSRNEEVLEAKITFPTATNTGAIINETVPTEVLSSVIDMYEKGFESLNQAGYDFYEFFKAVMATDPNNAQSYIMAYTMASSMDKSVTKSSLLASAEFYLNEISKVYKNYDTEGKEIKNKLINEQRKEKENLQSEIKAIQNEIIALQERLEVKTRLVLNYDSGNTGTIHEIDQKIIANDLAKNRIIQKISLVISGINNNI